MLERTVFRSQWRSMKREGKQRGLGKEIQVNFNSLMAKFSALLPFRGVCGSQEWAAHRSEPPQYLRVIPPELQGS